jgi:hypothetical protein
MPMPVHKQHPAKPRVHPAPVPGNNGNGSTTGKSTGNGTNNNHDWPRAEFRSPDKSTG